MPRYPRVSQARTYKRQAWSLADPTQGPTGLCEGDWLTDVRKIGAEKYYPPLDM